MLAIIIVMPTLTAPAYAQETSRAGTIKVQLPQKRWQTDQRAVDKVFLWNGMIIAEGYRFWVVDPSKEQAKFLAIKGIPHPIALATYRNTQSLALCRNENGLRLFSVCGEQLTPILIPKELQHFKGSPFLACDHSSIVLIADGVLHSCKQGSWSRVEVNQLDACQRFDLFGLLHGNRWPPDHYLLAGDMLYVGYDRGEFGGGLFGLHLPSGHWQRVDPLREDPSGRPVTEIKRGIDGGLVISEGLQHLGFSFGRIRCLHQGRWSVILSSEGLRRGSKPNQDPARASLASFAFDKEGVLHILTNEAGVFRREDTRWEHLTPDWPEGVTALSLLITRDGKGIISLYDAGILIWDFETQEVKRITLEREEPKPERPPTSQSTSRAASQPTSQPASQKGV